jgi:uracil-DNA glycosylase
VALADLIPADWQNILHEEISKDYFSLIDQHLESCVTKGIEVYPEYQHIFEALKQCSWAQVKVVILGQDPYHGYGQAHGLSFSVSAGVKIPPSLVNIYKELSTDIGCAIPTHGDLTAWAKQGVLLLNASLTVESGAPMSHAKIGWEKFTDEIINTISQEKQNIVFVLWGSFAQTKSNLIDETKHLVIKNVHPSPLSVYRGFFGSRPFTTINNYLSTHNIQAIDWQIV